MNQNYTNYYCSKYNLQTFVETLSLILNKKRVFDLHFEEAREDNSSNLVNVKFVQYELSLENAEQQMKEAIRSVFNMQFTMENRQYQLIQLMDQKTAQMFEQMMNNQNGMQQQLNINMF